MYEQGCRVVISVKKRRMEEAKKNGLTPYRTWDKGYKIDPKTQTIQATKKEERLRGTFGLSPYLPEGEARGIFLVDIPRERIAPVYTGPNATFNGVVQISGKIVAPEQLYEIEQPKTTPLDLIRSGRKKMKKIISVEPPQPSA